MKKLILLIWILLIGLSYSQTNGKWVIDNYFRVYNDSLQYTAHDTDFVKDSVWVITLTDDFSFIKIKVAGNSNDPVDSISAKLGVPIYNQAGSTIIDTVWGLPVALKDSSWSTVNTMINTSRGVDYTLYQPPPYYYLKLSLLNHIGTLRERTVQITVEAVKQ